MDLANIISGDLELVADGLTTVTVAPPTNISGGIGSVSLKALPEAISTREAAISDGRYLSSDVAFSFQINRATPLIGGFIVTATDTYTIIDVSEQPLSTRWRCVCREYNIESYLDTTITIRQRSFSKGSDGSAVQNASIIASGVVAHIQWKETIRQLHLGRRTGKVTGIVYFKTQQLLDQSNDIVAADGTVCTFVSDGGRDSITGLYFVNVERYV